MAQRHSLCSSTHIYSPHKFLGSFAIGTTNTVQSIQIHTFGARSYFFFSREFSLAWNSMQSASISLSVPPTLLKYLLLPFSAAGSGYNNTNRFLHFSFTSRFEFFFQFIFYRNRIWHVFVSSIWVLFLCIFVRLCLPFAPFMWSSHWNRLVYSFIDDARSFFIMLLASHTN